MLVNLIPEFLSCCAATDPVAAYHDYLDRHRPILASYWHNYVLAPGRVPAGHYRVTVAVTDLSRLVKSQSVALDVTLR